MRANDERDTKVPGRLWSVHDVADLMNVTTKTVYRHIRDQTLGAVRVGPRLMRVPQGELVAFLGARRTQGAEPLQCIEAPKARKGLGSI